MQTIEVPVVSGFESKINWTQVLGVLASLLTAFGFDIPSDLVPAVLVAVQAGIALVTVILRTWFTTSIT